MTTTAPHAPADLAITRSGSHSRSTSSHADKRVGLIGTLIIVAGLLLGVSGAATWALVQDSLAAESITVAEDAARFGGEPVDGPLTAYFQADIIEQHALESSAGKTYAELDREDPVRATVMNGSFLRASLFTSVLAFGVSALAMGLGVIFVLIGFALRTLRSTSDA